jgi:hypothetical protein
LVLVRQRLPLFWCYLTWIISPDYILKCEISQCFGPILMEV